LYFLITEAEIPIEIQSGGSQAGAMTASRIATACLTIAVAAGCAAPADEPAGFTIDRLLALSDGDYLASTYADGMLAPAESDHRDLLTALRVRDGVVTTAEVEVSNSVTAAPEVLALSPDGTTAFVAERLGQRRAGDMRANQLPAGNRLFAVDVSDLETPEIAGVATIAESPEAIAAHPTGTHVAVISNTPDRSVLQLVHWTSAGFGEVDQFDLADLGITGDADSARGGVTATNVQWHPSGRAVAVNINTQNRVAFFDVDTSTPGRPTVRPWGRPVTTGIDPFVGRFTPDGRYYLTSDWGRNLATTNVVERLPSARSKASVIAVGEIGTGSPQVVASAESDKSAEGLAVSPDGRWVATVNMRGTALPAGSPTFDEHGSVSLFRLDGNTGALTKIGDYRLDGVLSEGGTFDPSGRFFIATAFQGATGGDGAGLQVYRVGSDDNPGLTPVQRIPLPHGVHHAVTD
jgi:hypothetical protein